MRLRRFLISVFLCLSIFLGYMEPASAWVSTSTRQAASSTAWTPAKVSGLKLWLKFDNAANLFQLSNGTTAVSSDGDPIGYVTDLSGQGNYFVQSTENKRPTWQTNEIGGKSVALFDGLNDLLVRSSNIDSSNNGTFFVIFSSPTVTSTKYLFASCDEGTASYCMAFSPYYTSGTDHILMSYQNNNGGADGIIGETEITSTTNYFWVARSNGAAYSFRLNGGEETLAAWAGSNTGDWFGDTANRDSFSIGGLKYSEEGAWANVKILEIGLYDSNLTGSDLARLERYLASRTNIVPVTGVVIGDSTIAAYNGTTAVATFLLASADLVLGSVNSIAVPGHTIAQQNAAWDALTASQKSVYRWVIVEIGLNDLNPAESAATALARLQTLIDDIRAETPSGCKIIIATMTPLRQRLIDIYGATDGLISYQKWLDMNTAITGGGSSPITGVDAVVSSHTAALNDGSGNLAAEYDTGDHVHENDAARQIIADAWAVALQSLGF